TARYTSIRNIGSATSTSWETRPSTPRRSNWHSDKFQVRIYSEDRLRLGFEALKRIYGNAGYLNFTAEPRFDFDEPQKIVNLAIQVDEDRQFSVNRINFTRNTRTRDDVIRQEILIKEGEIFNASLWDRSLDRLNQLGYVDQIKNEDVSFKLSPTDDRYHADYQ